MKKLFTIPLLAMVLTSCVALNALMVDEAELNDLLRALRTDAHTKVIDLNKGYRRTVKTEEVEKAFVAKDIDALCDGLKMLLYRDFAGLKKAEQEGRMFWFGPETYVITTSLKRMKYWVIVDNGPHKGKQGWVFFPMLDPSMDSPVPLDPTKNILWTPIMSYKETD